MEDKVKKAILIDRYSLAGLLVVSFAIGFIVGKKTKKK